MMSRASIRSIAVRLRWSCLTFAVLGLAVIGGHGCSPQAGSVPGAQPQSLPHATAPAAPPLVSAVPYAVQAIGPTPVPQIGQTGPGFEIAVHPGGSVFAVASGANVLLFDVETAAERAILVGEKDKRALAFTPDGTLLLAGGMGAELEAWNLGTGERRVYGKEDDIIFHILPAPGNGLVVGTRLQIGWRSKLEEASRRIAPAGSSYAVHPRERVLYGTSTGLIAWNLDSGQELWRRALEGNVRDGRLALSGDGKLVAWSPDGKRLVLHDARTGAPVSTLSNLSGVSYPRLSADGRRVAVQSSKGVHLFDTGRRTQVALLDKHSAEVLGFSPDSTHLGTIAARGVHVVRADDGAHVGFLPMRDRRGDLLWSLDSKAVIGRLVNGRNGTWYVSEQRKTVVERDWVAPRALAWAPDGRHVVVVESDRSYVVDARTATITEQLRGPEKAGSIATASWSPDGRSLALGTHTSLLLQNRSTGEVRTLLNDTQFSVRRQPHFSPDGRMLLMVGTRDGAPILFAHHGAQQPKILASVGHVSEAAWRGDSGAIAFGGETHLKVFDVLSDQVGFSVAIPSHVMRGAWLGNDRIVTAHATGEVLVWRVGQAQPDRTLLPGGAEGRQVAVSGDGQWIGAMTRKGVVRIWDARDYRLVTSEPGDGRDGVDLAWVPCSQTLSVLRGEVSFVVPGGKVMALNLLEPDRGDTPDVLMTRVDGAYAGTPGGMAALRLRGTGPLLSAPLQTAAERPDLHAPEIGSPWLGRCGGR